MTRLVCCAGCTRTAVVDGISAAGADADLLAHTPSADAEVLVYGRPVRAPAVPVSPTGCPTPAAVTRAVVDRLDVDVTVVDAGLAEPTGAPAVDVGASPGGDVRQRDPVPDARSVFEDARRVGRELPDDDVLVAETIPGGTTTALGVLTALGEADVADRPVSSSLPDNPLDLKRRVVAEGLSASGLAPGEASDPIEAIRRVGDPVLAAAAGVVAGAMEADGVVTLAGGTQLATVAACLRRAGYDGPLELATTSFLADAVDVEALASAFSLSTTVTDPGFGSDHPAEAGFLAGEAKEGAGMGGAFALADRRGLPMGAVRSDLREWYDSVLGADREVVTS